MGISAKCGVAFLYFLNIVFVCMGYVGIDKLDRYDFYSFLDEQPRGGFHTTGYVVGYISPGTICFWHFHPAAVWAGTVLVPLIAVFILFRNERLFTGVFLLLLSFIPFGVTGFLIWFHAYIDLPHDW